ncbi:hypothetical protein FHP25_25040 [Vineibacter terrae]|uniref:Uncharacterized protein n=1 Tax=Vineibacter terrae TaxID=2586908 RepID=A0A5C8PFX2_9HYPH|nr:hypothetical protein [Vineibacter terrae]TXL72565.1 hypothetical protein FHP25_25040 [Vineibacter terrae]
MAEQSDDFVLQQSTTTGLGDYIIPSAVSGFRTFLAVFGNGGVAEYVARLPDYSKWEHGWGVVSNASGGRITRNLLRSSTGSLIDWQAGDAMRVVHTITSADRLWQLRRKHYGSTEPPLKQKGMDWLDSTGAPTGTAHKLWDGTQWITVGTLNETTHKYLRNLTDDFPAWTAYTPVVTSSVGSFTSVSASGSYIQRGKLVAFRTIVTITTNGTAAGGVELTHPVAPIGPQQNCSAHANGPSNFTCWASILASPAKLILLKYDGTYPGASGMSLYANGVYEAA